MSLPLILTLVALAILAATLVLVILPLAARLRAQESLGGDTETSSASGGSELRELTERIEAAVTQQQQQGETQRQRLAQQIDGVQQGVGEQRVLIDNLRSEVRHESQRRDHELEEIRHQIASIHNAMPALGAAPEAETLALPAADEASATADAVVPDPFVSETQDLVDSASSSDAESSWEEVAWEVDAAPLASSTPAQTEDEPALAAVENEDIFTFEDTFADATFADIKAAVDEIAPPETVAEETPSEASAESTDAPTPSPIEPDAAPVDAAAEPASAAESAAAPELSIDELAIPSIPDAAAPNAWSVQSDAPAEAEAPAEAVFEELTLAEMSFEEFSFEDFAVEEIDTEDAGVPGDVEAGAFDADPFTIEETVDPFVVTDESPKAAPAPQKISPEPAASALPETPPASSEAGPDASTQSDAGEAPFAPTAFLDAPLSAADPLAFEEAFVPAPIVDAAPEPTEMADDLFAAWSPTETPEPAPEPLVFAEAPASSDGHAATPEAAPSDASSTDLSTFEDWGLDPVPMAAPASDAAWTVPETTSNAFESWAPSQATTPEPIPTPRAAPDPPNATAWVARNESLQPTPPPARQPEAPAVAPYAEAAPVADPAELASGFEPQPAHAEAPVATPTDAASAYATLPGEPASSPAPALATAQALAAQAPAAQAPAAQAPAAQAPAEPAAAPSSAQDALEGDSERLTVLPSIDEDTERALHLAGVTSLDEMARWGRTEARRIATTVGVSEETVLNHWVFEAQTALFERFTQQAGA